MDLMQAEFFTDQIISVMLERITPQQLPQIAWFYHTGNLGSQNLTDCNIQSYVTMCFWLSVTYNSVLLIVFTVRNKEPVTFNWACARSISNVTWSWQMSTWVARMSWYIPPCSYTFPPVGFSMQLLDMRCELLIGAFADKCSVST